MSGGEWTPDTLKVYVDAALDGIRAVQAQQDAEMDRRFTAMGAAIEASRVAMRGEHDALRAAWHDRFSQFESLAAKRLEELSKAVGLTSKLVWVGVGLAIAVSVFLPLLLTR